MNGFSVGAFSGLPLGVGLGNAPRNQPAGGGTTSGDGGNGSTEGSARQISANTAEAPREAAPTQSVSATPVAAGSTGASKADAAETGNPRAFNRLSPDATGDRAAQAPAEQAATRMFFDSILSSVTTTPRATDVSARPATPTEEPPHQPANNSFESTLAKDRFLEGLKLVNGSA